MSNPPSIPSDTNLITELDVATAALLAKRAGGLELNGIKSLTPEVARELGRFQGEWLLLRGLTSLPADVAEELLPIAQKLGIGGPDYDEMGGDFSVAHLFGGELAPSVARLLADRCAGGGDIQYTIPEHTCIGADAAAILASIQNEDVTLTLRSIKKLDADLATSLGHFRAFLRLPNLAEITEMQARQLAEGNVSLEVEATTDMSTAAVREIVRSRGCIEFNAPDMLARHAEAFADAHCDLRIRGGADGKAALALSRSGASRITLYCKDLSDEAAAALARFSGVIGLPHLEHLRSTPGHVALAAKLAQQCTEGSNWLPIQSLGREAARAIAEAPAPSMQLGLRVLSPEVAVELSRFTGKLTMLDLECLSAEVSAALAHGKMKALSVGCKSMGCDVAHIWACHGLADLTLWLSPDTVTVDVVNALASGNRMNLCLTGGSISAAVVDAYLASPQLNVLVIGVIKNLHGWPIALPKDRSLVGLESVSVVGDHPGLTRISGIGFAPSFPSLKSLTVHGCPNIKELDFRGPAGASPVQDPPLHIEVTKCKRLEKLVIMTERCCAQNLKLAALPKCQEIHIKVPDLTDLGAFSTIASIEKLGLYQSPALRSLAGVQNMVRLRHVLIKDCPQIEHLDELEGLRGLESLHIEDCPGIDSLEFAAKLPSLRVLTLRGKTGIVSLRCLRGRDDVTVNIECGDIGVPPAVVKNAYQYEGADCLGQFKHALVECYQCGGQQFRGSCHGWYARIGGAVVSRSAPLDGVDYLAAAKVLFASLESDAQSNGLEDAAEDTTFDRFPVLHAEVTCDICDTVFDPASFGAGTSPAMGGNWSEVGEARSDTATVREHKHLDVDFSVDGNEAERPASEAGKCPICCKADLKLSISGRAQRETAGKFSGHVVIDRTPWSELPNCFHFDEGDEKAGGSWEWSHMPRASRDMKMSCANGCFESPVNAAEQVPNVLLASLAMYESHRAQPDLDLLAGWIGGLAKTAGKPEKLVFGAVVHIDNIDPECVPRASESADPKTAALELCTKAKALLDQALALAKKPKTRERSRPQAKPKKEQGAGEGPLAGRVFCFTGRLEGMSRAEAEGRVKALGAATADSITKKVTDVVVGEDAGSKRAKALEMGLEVHDQEAFEALLRGLA
jgi:BRCA1 C Terminus (BRCT) domain